MSGFIYCRPCARNHWGRHGAAGLLLVSEHRVLLTRRSEAVDVGGTWSIPGGALELGELPEQAAARESIEELAGLDLDMVRLGQRHVDDHGIWRYTTVVAYVPDAPRLWPRNGESTAARWVPCNEVARMRGLHPAFARSWPSLRRLVETRG